MRAVVVGPICLGAKPLVRMIKFEFKEVRVGNTLIVRETNVMRYALAVKLNFFVATSRFILQEVTNHLLGFTHDYKLEKNTDKNSRWRSKSSFSLITQRLLIFLN